MARVVNDENQPGRCRPEHCLEDGKCSIRHSRIPVAVRTKHTTPLQNGLTKDKKELQKPRWAPLIDTASLTCTRQRRKVLPSKEDPLLLKTIRKMDASPGKPLSQTQPNHGDTGITVPYKLRSSQFPSTGRTHKQSLISNRFSELCDTVLARSSSIAGALSAQAHSRVISRTQRVRENLEDVKLNLEVHLVSSSFKEKSSRCLPRSPSLPCLSTLRYQECYTTPTLTPSITRSHSMVESSFLPTCTVLRSNTSRLATESEVPYSPPTKFLPIELFPSTSHSNTATRKRENHCTTDNFYSVDDELLTIFANAAKPAALSRNNCPDPVAQLLLDEAVLLPSFLSS